MCRICLLDDKKFKNVVITQYAKMFFFLFSGKHCLLMKTYSDVFPPL